MKVTIEQFNNGNTYTVVYSDTVYTEMEAKDWKGGFRGLDLDSGAIRGYCKGGELYWTALPPLPKKLTDDNAKLLYDYEAHGLCLVGDVEEFCTGEDNDLGNTYRAVHILKYVDSMLPNNVTLLYAINEQNERVEIAIYDRELQK